MMIRFDSDYLEGCLPEIIEVLGKTNLEQTSGYGNDSYCDEARSLICEVIGNRDADVHFLVGGTQANVTVISSLLRPHQGVLCADSGHINVHETGAVEHSGHKVLALPSKDGKISAAQISLAVQMHNSDSGREHTVQPGMVYISFPTELGTLYSLRELTDISRVCKENRIPLFIDGARIGYGLSSPACDLSIRDIASLCDVFYIGGTKQGALFGEAVVFRDTSLSGGFRYSIKQNGGLLAKGRLLGLQFRVLFTDGLYLKAARGAVEKALLIKEAFKNSGVDMLVDSPTNQQFPILKNCDIEVLRKDFGFEDWKYMDELHTAVRFVTSWATTDDSVAALVTRISEMI